MKRPKAIAPFLLLLALALPCEFHAAPQVVYRAITDEFLKGTPDLIFEWGMRAPGKNKNLVRHIDADSNDLITIYISTTSNPDYAFKHASSWGSRSAGGLWIYEIHLASPSVDVAGSWKNMSTHLTKEQMETKIVMDIDGYFTREHEFSAIKNIPPSTIKSATRYLFDTEGQLSRKPEEIRQNPNFIESSSAIKPSTSYQLEIDVEESIKQSKIIEIDNTKPLGADSTIRMLLNYLEEIIINKNKQHFRGDLIADLEQADRKPLSEKDRQDLDSLRKSFDVSNDLVRNNLTNLAEELSKDERIHQLEVSLLPEDAAEMARFVTTMGTAQFFGPNVLNELIDEVKDNYASLDLFFHDDALFPGERYSGPEGEMRRESELFSTAIRLKYMEKISESAPSRKAYFMDIREENFIKMHVFKTTDATRLNAISVEDRIVSINTMFELSNSGTRLVAAAARSPEALKDEKAELYKRALESSKLPDADQETRLKDFKDILNIRATAPEEIDTDVVGGYPLHAQMADMIESYVAGKYTDAKATFDASRERFLAEAKKYSEKYAEAIQEDEKNEDTWWESDFFSEK